MKVLLAGFEPFGGETINPSEEVARGLAASGATGMTLTTAVVPVVFGEDVERVWPLWDAFGPDLVLLLGQNAGAAGLQIERFAHNLKRERDGESHRESPILPGGPLAYAASLPVTELAARLRASGIPATVSRDAGDYLCNHLMYQALHRAALREEPTRVGFIHLPFLPEQAARHPGRPCMTLELMTAGVVQTLEYVKGRGENLESGRMVPSE